MNAKQRMTVVLVLAISLIASGCAPGQIFGPTVTPTPTLTPTHTPIPPTSTNTPIPPTAATSSGYVIPVQKCAPNCTYKDMAVGYIQTDYSEGWHTANNASFAEAAQQLGITMKTYEAQNKDDQISAFHTFNQDHNVNVIIISLFSGAQDAKGFDDVLKEAQANGKLVILNDSLIDSSSDLYYTHIGSDFVAEGQRGAAAMCKLLANSPKKNVVEISGPSDPSIDRGIGFREKMGDCGITVTDSQNGNWNAADSKVVMAAFLKQSTDIQGVFAHNDEEAIGAIQAIKEAGLVPGKDIQVVGIDATADGFQYLISGELGADIECNPLIGPQAFDAALKGLNGDTTMPKLVPPQEAEFFAAQGADALKAILVTRKY